MQAQELGNPETLTRIAQYELAYRMQTSVPAVMDISQESKHIIDAYGAEPRWIKSCQQLSFGKTTG